MRWARNGLVALFTVMLLAAAAAMMAVFSIILLQHLCPPPPGKAASEWMRRWLGWSIYAARQQRWKKCAKYNITGIWPISGSIVFTHTMYTRFAFISFKLFSFFAIQLFSYILSTFHTFVYNGVRGYYNLFLLFCRTSSAHMIGQNNNLMVGPNKRWRSKIVKRNNKPTNNQTGNTYNDEWMTYQIIIDRLFAALVIGLLEFGLFECVCDVQCARIESPIFVVAVIVRRWIDISIVVVAVWCDLTLHWTKEKAETVEN